MSKIYVHLYASDGAVLMTLGYIIWPVKVLATEVELHRKRGRNNTFLHVYESGATVSTINLEDLTMRDLCHD